MYFRLRKDARNWFRGLSKVLKVEFDAYYFCLMAGLASRRKEEVGSDEATDLVDYFPGEYRPYGRLIVGLFLRSELDMEGVPLKDAKAVRSVLAHLVSTNSPSLLSDDGMREINKFANGGFEVLEVRIGEAPKFIELFLPAYKTALETELTGRSQ